VSAIATSGPREQADSARTLALQGVAPVAMALLCSRLIVLGADVLLTRSAERSPTFHDFAVWDGLWYRDIALYGYERYRPGRTETAYPFFPLLPAILRVATWLGLPLFATGVVLNHTLFLVGLLGLWLLVRRLHDARSATLAVWVAALLPGSQAYSMIYPEAIIFAASTWAFWLAGNTDRSVVGNPIGRTIGVGLLGAVTSLARPNGVLVPISLALGSLLTHRGSWRRAACYLVPGALAIGSWMLHLWSAKEDPLLWIRAKGAWEEITIVSLINSDLRPRVHDFAPIPLAAAALWWTWGRLPASWRVFASLWVALPLITGMKGWPRYMASCFPVAAAAGIVLARLPLWSRTAVLRLLGIWLAWYSYRVLGMQICP